MSETDTTTDEELIDAYQPTPTGAVIRIRCYQTDDGWTEAVEVVTGSRMRNGRVVSDDEERTVLYEGQGLKVAQVYNQTVEPYIRVELEAAKERRDEAEAEGDTIEYLNAKKYIEELEEQLP